MDKLLLCVKTCSRSITWFIDSSCLNIIYILLNDFLFYHLYLKCVSFRFWIVQAPQPLLYATFVATHYQIQYLWLQTTWVSSLWQMHQLPTLGMISPTPQRQQVNWLKFGWYFAGVKNSNNFWPPNLIDDFVIMFNLSKTKFTCW